MASKVNLDVSEQLDITCRKGDTFDLTLTLKDSSGTGLTLTTSKYQFVMQVWPVSQSRGSKPVIISLERGLKDLKDKGDIPYFEPFTTDDSGNVTIKATAANMQKVPAGRYVYDLQYILPNASSGVETHTTILRGAFIVNDDVSKIISKPRRPKKGGSNGNDRL